MCCEENDTRELDGDCNHHIVLTTLCIFSIDPGVGGRLEELLSES